jgi:hypothetical protein
MLAAFADGELDGEQNLKVLEQVKQDPAAADRVTGHQKLREAVARAMDEPAHKAPADLRDKLAELARTVLADYPAATPLQAPSPVLARIGRWAPAAVAAVLMVGALVAISINTANNAGPGAMISSASILSTSMVERFGNRHVKCATKAEPMYGVDQFPQNLTELPGALSEYFHQPIDPQVLNLSGLGYTFDVAGLCVLPAKGAVHMLYQPQTPTDQSDSLSLWMRPHDEVSIIEADKLYASPATETEHPMIAWRHGSMDYYLVGDDYETVQEAFDAIRSHQD